MNSIAPPRTRKRPKVFSQGKTLADVPLKYHDRIEDGINLARQLRSRSFIHFIRKNAGRIIEFFKTLSIVIKQRLS